MKFRTKSVLLRIVAGVTLLSGGIFVGYRVGLARQHYVLTRPHLREIVSPMSHSTSTGLVGSAPSPGYSVAAFEMVDYDLADIMQSLVGDDYSSYDVYVLPVNGGFKLVIHHNNEVPVLTDQQYSQLIERVQTRLAEETAKEDIQQSRRSRSFQLRDSPLYPR